MSNATTTQNKKRCASPDFDSDNSLPPSLKRIKLAHPSTLEKQSSKPKGRVVPKSKKTVAPLAYRIVETPLCTLEESSSPVTSEATLGEERPRVTYRVIPPSLLTPKERETPVSEPTSPASSTTRTPTLRLTIKIPPLSKVSPPQTPLPRTRRSKYVMDPLARREELAKVPEIQFIENTPYAVFCRACRRTHDLERRGTGWYVQNWFERHAQTSLHKKMLSQWLNNGGDDIAREDEEVQWTCVYWKVWCEEEGREVVLDRVVKKEDAAAAEEMMAFWRACGVSVESAREEDMIAFVKGAGSKRRRSCGLCKSRGK